jgi:AraC-like DNA-binding protein
MITINSNHKINISYASSGHFIAQDEWIHPKRVIDTYEIIFVTHGHIFIKEKDNDYVVSENNVLILNPYCEHGGYKSSDADTSFYWFHFYLSNSSFLSTLPKCFSTSDSLKIRTLLNQLLDTANSSNYPAYTADLIVCTILCELMAQYRSSKNSSNRLCNEIAEWIRINNDKKVTISMVSDKFGYNGDYLSRLFKSYFNIGIKEYICKERIKAAKNMLLSSYYSVKQISDILGWDNENQFIKFFKYHESVSPKKYRDIYKNTHLNKK